MKLTTQEICDIVVTALRQKGLLAHQKSYRLRFLVSEREFEITEAVEKISPVLELVKK